MQIRRGWSTLALAVALAGVASAAMAQHRPISALNWAFGGTVHTVARAGRVAFVGGRFNAVASRHNVTGGFAVVSPATSQRALRAVRVHGNVNAIVPDGSGGWFVGGHFTFVGQDRRPQIAHILANGRLDPAWSGRVDGRVLSLALVGSTLYVGGEFARAGDGAGPAMPEARQNIAAFAAADGALLAGAAAGADGAVSALAVSGSTLFAGGDFATFLGQSRQRLGAYDTGAGTVTAWAPSADAPVRTIVAAADGATVYVGGAFANTGGAARAFLAEIDTATGLATTWNPGASDLVAALSLVGETIYAGGRFTQLGGGARNHVGAVHAASGALLAWDPNADDTVLALAVSGGTVYLGGEFLNVGGKLRLHAAAVALGTGAVSPWHPAPNDPVRAIVATAERVALGGAFEALGGHLRRNLAAIDLETGRLLPWRPRPDGAVLALAVARDRRLYVGGAFTTIAGQSRDRLAAFDLPTHALASWNPGADAAVRALAAFTDTLGDTTVYAGGDFTMTGGQARSHLAAIAGASGLALPGFAPGPTTGTVLALDVNAAHLYAGGQFTALGGAALPYLGRVDRLTGSADAAWAPAPDEVVRAVNLGGDTVYAGGVFSTIAGVGRTNAAALRLTAPATATAWQPNPDRAVNAIDRDGPYVFLGGAFRTVDGLFRPRLAAVLAAATDSGPYLLPWRPKWYGVVQALDARLEGLLVGGEALPDLDDQEFDPVGRVAFYPRAGVPGRPGAPTDLHTFTDGDVVGLEWGPPPNGAEPRFYVLEAGTSSGTSNITGGLPIGADTSFEVPGVPPGTYYLRVRAVSAGGVGPASDEVELVVGPSGCVARPEPPMDLDAVVNGGIVTITWTESATPGVSGYRVVANPFGGGSSFSTLVPAGTTSFSAAAPRGVFVVGVRAVSACGASARSNEVVLGVGGAEMPPGAPLDIAAVVNGSAVTFSWAAPVTGGAAGGYLLEAGSGPGMSDMARVPVNGTTLTAPNVPGGTYFVRVRAVNNVGFGDASAELQVIVP
ncbi:MAG: fibronectin type III domain-containing protein [Acidobacteria bacterium]|nr:fibronectin type III domain-containing protein [Acidobacteriota bacterium]